MHMDKILTFDWKSVSVSAKDLLALVRQYRGRSLDVLFHYAEDIYHIGVKPENTREPFFFDEDTYPSLLALSSSAIIEGGFLLPDLQAPLDVLSVNDEDPALYFQTT